MGYTYKEKDVEEALEAELVKSNKYEHIWRQVKTHRGRLDILGVEKSGLVQVWEIKRGYITERDLVQMLGYKSTVQGIVSSRIADITPLDFFWDEIEVCGTLVGRGLHSPLVKRMFFEFDFSFLQYLPADRGGFYFDEIKAHECEEAFLKKPSGSWVDKIALVVAGGLARKRSREYIQSAGNNPDVNPMQSRRPAVSPDGVFAEIAERYIRKNGSDVMWRRDG